MKEYSKYGFKILTVIFSLAAFNAQAIQKCKDAEGKWHYGDAAQTACASAEVTTLTERGFIKDKLAAPKTEEELLVEAELEREQLELDRAELELAEKRQKDQEERQRILSIYEREEDIDRQRDNQLASVDGNIRVHKAYLKQMDSKVLRLEGKSASSKGRAKENLDKELLASKSRIEEFSTELARLEEQKLAIMDKFANEKKLYRELKGI